jgi:hypothetical protein
MAAMRRTLAGWILPFGLGVTGAICLTWLAGVLAIPFRPWMIALITVGVVGQVAIWIASGGTVIAILTWLVPTVIASAVVITWPTTIGFVVVGVLLVLPLMGGVFEPIGRRMARYSEFAAGAVMTATLSRRERGVRAALRAAFSDKQVRADVRQLEDLPRTLAAYRRQVELIRSVRAPDEDWARVIEAFAAAITTYHDMLAGLRPMDYDVAKADMLAADRMRRDLLRSRSVAYRVLTHQFRPDPEADAPAARAAGND